MNSVIKQYIRIARLNYIGYKISGSKLMILFGQTAAWLKDGLQQLVIYTVPVIRNDCI